jgi:hypothetical protein
VAITFALLNLLPVILGFIPGISPKMQQVINDVAGGAAGLIKSGAISHPTASTILSAWIGVIETLKKDPSLPPSSLKQIAELSKAVQAALLQDELAARMVDWSLIKPIALVPVPVPATN